MHEHLNVCENDIVRYLQQHQTKELVRLITCGSVDDGKSTLIGRMLYDSKMIFEDQIAEIEKDSRKTGSRESEVDFALLVDGLQSEREQGITIDVAYRFFFTSKRKFIMADTPGHEQYTRNMVTGASTADLAIILIDASRGVQLQTRRHSYIASLLGIRNIIVAVNKMDLVDFSKERFEAIKGDYERLIPTLPNHEQIAFYYIPVSALKGDNIVHKSERMPWYPSDPLMQMLDTISVQRHQNPSDDAFRFPVQYVNRASSDFRGFCGTVFSGKIRVGDEITVLPAGRTTHVKSIVLPSVGSELSLCLAEEASAPMAITLTTEDEIDIGRGDMIALSSDIPDISDSFKVMVVWMDGKPMTPVHNYLIKSTTATVEGHIESIDYTLDMNTFEKISVLEFRQNDIGMCQLLLHRPIAVDPYRLNRSTGSFIMIDRVTNATVGAGMILEINRPDQDSATQFNRVYTKEEIELNLFVRTHFPEWGCKVI